ncbi:hypothetical protein M9H77_04318 [Catharanthus roseus]|uniref:Uncharacterized protein n=1 Tax=Catharanthus roseus TaxID=4058 RepID=A0ACC0CDS6_CATRO|nr:hypothetical protein M9H77_04318 [Catharanthus roseus]
MVKVKNVNIGRDGHGEEGGSSRGGKKKKDKQIARSEIPSDKFISVKAAANYEDWIKKKRKISPGHRVDLSDMAGMEIIPAHFQDIGWGSLLIVNELFYPMMLYEFYANLQRGRIQAGGNVVTSRVNGKNIAFDDRLLNSILETPEDGIFFYTKNRKCFDPNLYSEKRFEELFTKGIVLNTSEDRTIDKLDAYGRILHHIISNIVIPNVGHKCSITNMHSFVMLAMHEHRKMNFGYIAIEHMLATQSSSTKCLPYGCFLTKVFQHFNITFFGPNEHIGIGKIYNQNTFKRMGFSRNKDGKLIRGGQEEDSENSEKEEEEKEEGNEPEDVDEQESDSETEEERFRREIRKKKRQERTEEGSSSGSMTQLMEIIASLQTSMNTRFDALDGKISDIQERILFGLDFY